MEFSKGYFERSGKTEWRKNLVAIKIEGGLFKIESVNLSPRAKTRAAYLQARQGRKGDEALMVHTSVLVKLHATGEHGDLPASDRRLNRKNIRKNEGRVLSVIGEKFPFVITTELPSGETWISIPEEW